MPKLILEHFAPTNDLSKAIASRLRALEQKSVKERLTVYGGIFVASLLLLVPFMLSLRDNLVASGFVSYSSLLFSDFGALTPSIKEFTLSLFESLPVLSLALNLILISISLWSLLALSALVVRNRGLKVLARQ